MKQAGGRMKIWNQVRERVSNAKRAVCDLRDKWRAHHFQSTKISVVSADTRGIRSDPTVVAAGNDATLPRKVETADLVNNLKTHLLPTSTSRPVYRFVAVPKGLLKGQPGTVDFLYPKKLKCGCSLVGPNGRRYVIVERQMTDATISKSEVDLPRLTFAPVN